MHGRIEEALTGLGDSAKTKVREAVDREVKRKVKKKIKKLKRKLIRRVLLFAVVAACGVAAFKNRDRIKTLIFNK